MISEREVFKTLDSARQDEHTWLWKVPADLPYFDGHFPGNPIFPAVGIVDASVYILKKILNQPKLYVPHYPVAKFMSPISPESTVRIELKQLNEKEWLAEWKDEAAAKLLASFRIDLG